MPVLRPRRGLLRAKGVTEIEKVRVDLDPARRAEMMERTGRRTVPQIYIGDTYVGGCDDLYELEHQGKLNDLLAANDRDGGADGVRPVTLGSTGHVDRDWVGLG